MNQFIKAKASKSFPFLKYELNRMRRERGESLLVRQRGNGSYLHYYDPELSAPQPQSRVGEDNLWG